MNDVFVLDASAVLALLGNEPGCDFVEQAIDKGALLSAVNAAEILSKLGDGGIPAGVSEEILGGIGIEIVPFDQEQAHAVGALRVVTKSYGLSLGDRACLALAIKRNATVITADKAWTTLEINAQVKSIR